MTSFPFIIKTKNKNENSERGNSEYKKGFI